MSTNHYPPSGDPHHIDETAQPLTACSQTGSTRAFWGVMGLSYVASGLAIYGCLTERVSPYLTWPMLLAGMVMIVIATRFLRKS